MPTAQRDAWFSALYKYSYLLTYILTRGALWHNMTVGTLALDGWTVTFGTARRGLDGWHHT